ncbi:hypothetical protein X777_12726 [Ooceraea biroi]|uniref:Uncharacterized protein n=1 Tax=Ooceraea biroi TaxID=2015173 RepID=A0A026VYR7_OOCBI|nr:hypothetical protein X777_12726 [Ooceraea biroi]
MRELLGRKRKKKRKGEHAPSKREECRMAGIYYVPVGERGMENKRERKRDGEIAQALHRGGIKISR